MIWKGSFLAEYSNIRSKVMYRSSKMILAQSSTTRTDPNYKMPAKHLIHYVNAISPQLSRNKSAYSDNDIINIFNQFSPYFVEDVALVFLSSPRIKFKDNKWTVGLMAKLLSGNRMSN